MKGKGKAVGKAAGAKQEVVQGEGHTGAPSTLSKMWELRKKLSRSVVRAQPAFHSSLGMSMYAQVTSPLRRYGDLLLHQQLRDFLDGAPLRTDAEVRLSLLV